MKYIYLLCAIVITITTSAQTNPTPQTIPYSQDFSGLAHTSTTYPAGLQGWQTGTSTGTTFKTNAPTADRVLVASSTAAVNSGNVHNYNGKIGFLTTGTLDVALALSLNASGKISIVVGYDAMTIRNPYDGTTNTRINEMALQYRVGTSGIFTTVVGSEYQNGTALQTTAVTTPQNTSAKSIALPPACDNQPVVQVRWVNRDVSGGGASASFAVDNIAVTSSTTGGSTVSIGAGTDASEPATNGSFNITLSTPAPAGGTVITYTLAGTATSSGDYTDPQNGTVTVLEASSSAIVNINVINDAVSEPTETIAATISSVSAPYSINVGNASINLLDDGDFAAISYTGVTYIQDFNSLATSGTSAVLPTGWLLNESGANANNTYAADNGGNSSGNTYTYGSGTATDRAFGGLRSGSLVPIIGAAFTNNTGAALSTVVVSYTGEQWRVGTANRADRLDFQYSTNATSLSNGTWTNVDALDFTGPVVSPVGAVDGNLSTSSAAVNFTINGLSIPNGSNFLFRWIDFDASGGDDGLAIDNFSLSPGCTPPTNQPTALTFTPGIQQIQGDFTNAASGAVNPNGYLVIVSTSATLTEQPSSGTAYAGDDVVGGGRVVAITNGVSNSFIVTDLTPGTPYYFFVYSFSSAGNCYNITNPLTGSQATNTPPPCTPPTIQASNLTASTVTSTSIALNYVRGNGNNVIIVARTGSPVTTEPINSISYPAGSTIGSDNMVIYNGPANTFNYTGLIQNTTYHFALFEYSSTESCYLKPGLTGSFITACATPVNVSSLTVSAGNTQSIVSWTTPTATCFDEMLVVVSTAFITGSGESYTGLANATYTSGGAPQVVFRGVGSNVTVTGLTNGTTYFVKVFTRLGVSYSAGVQVTVLPFDPANGFTYLFGNLHAHSSYSDGNKDNLANTPDEDFRFARDALCMDYMGMSEHNHSQAGMNYPDYKIGYNEANSVNLVPGAGGNTLVTLWGMEWGVISGGGHVLVYGFDSTLLGWEPGNYDILVPKSDYSSLWATINSKPGAIASLAHPNSSDFGNIVSGYNTAADNAIVGSAVESGPAFSTSTTYNDYPSSRFGSLGYWRNMLARGYHLAPTMDQDNHNLTFGTANANRTVLLAASKTRDAVMEAIRNNRFYASQDCNLQVDFKQGTNAMGSSVVKAGLPSFTLNVTDVNAEPVTLIELYGGQAGSNIVPGSPIKTYTDVSSFNFGNGDVENTQPASTTYYYYVIVTQADGDRAVTAPIWYTRNETILPVTFISFIAAYDNFYKTVGVRWSTAQEFNSKEFFIERSVDGINFKTIGSVPAGYNSQSIRQYVFNDQHPLEGTSYYRVRQVDIDSKMTYSSIGKVSTKAMNGAAYVVYPNPAKGFTHLFNTGTSIEKVTVQVLDNLGRVLSSKVETLNVNSACKIDLAGYKAGNYVLKVIGKEATGFQKIVVY